MEDLSRRPGENPRPAAADADHRGDDGDTGRRRSAGHRIGHAGRAGFRDPLPGTRRAHSPGHRRDVLRRDRRYRPPLRCRLLRGAAGAILAHDVNGQERWRRYCLRRRKRPLT